MPERRVRRVSGQRVATYAGSSVRAPRREKQPQNGFVFGRPEALLSGIPRDTFGIPAATLAGVACPYSADAKQRCFLSRSPRFPMEAPDAPRPPPEGRPLRAESFPAAP